MHLFSPPIRVMCPVHLIFFHYWNIYSLYVYIFIVCLYIHCILDFKLSPCFEYCIYSFGYFPGVTLTPGKYPKEYIHIHCMFMYPFGYSDWGFSVLFSRL
jgi:hypothetical protein